MHLNKDIDLKTKVHFRVSFKCQALKTVADPQENEMMSFALRNITTGVVTEGQTSRNFSIQLKQKNFRTF